MKKLLLQPSFIDVFCGAGGLTLGFTRDFGHQFRPIWAIDLDASAVATYNLNFGDHCSHSDIQHALRNGEVPKAHIVIGGPPCQGFSQLNKSRMSDPRRDLWRDFFDVVKASNAEVFVMENVPQLLKSSEFPKIIARSKELGFLTVAATLCAADFGVPQKRYRAFVIGCKFADPGQYFPPDPTHRNIVSNSVEPRNSLKSRTVSTEAPWKTVRDAIGDLQPPKGTELRSEPPPYNLHFGRNPTPVSLRRYKAIPKEGMNRFDLEKRLPQLTPSCWKHKSCGGTDLFGRLWWDRPSLTIRTEFFKPEKGRYLHPEQHRPLTHREAARLQGFPDNFEFVGSKTDIARQIGNAVPPPLAAKVADCIHAMLLSRGKTRD